MKTMSAKKWSVLGLVLMGASAVTAAILPKNNSVGNKAEANGSLTDSTAIGDTLTCKVTDHITNACFASTAAGVSNTTIVDQAISDLGDTTDGQGQDIVTNTTLFDNGITVE